MIPKLPKLLIWCVRLPTHQNLNQTMPSHTAVLTCHYAKIVILMLPITLMVVNTDCPAITAPVAALVAAPTAMIALKTIDVTNTSLLHSTKAALLATILFHSLPHPPTSTLCLNQILLGLITALGKPIPIIFIVIQHFNGHGHHHKPFTPPEKTPPAKNPNPLLNQIITPAMNPILVKSPQQIHHHTLMSATISIPKLKRMAIGTTPNLVHNPLRN